MKTKLIFMLILTMVTYCLAMVGTSYVYAAPNGGNIGPGAGYSSDSQQVAPKACYNTVINSTTDREGSLDVDTELSFDDLKNELRVDVDVEGSFWMFSVDAEASYLKEIEDKVYTFALHYYQYESAKAILQFVGKGVGQDALTELGKEQYNNEDAYPYFGIECGDRYLTDYRLGAQLVSSLQLEFKSQHEKEEFRVELGGSFKDIFSASVKVQQTAEKFHTDGTFSIKVLQKGGDPSKLPDVFRKDPSGKYYFLTCDLQDMDDCKKAAGGLISYAQHDFSTQVNFDTGEGLMPLGVGFSNSKHIREIGLNEPPSFVNDTVKADRLKLANEFKKNQYYQEKTHDLLKGYVDWDEGSDIYKQVGSLSDKAVHNIGVIDNSEEDQGAKECFNSPYMCDEVTKNIVSKLSPITSSDLGFLEDIKNMITLDVYKSPSEKIVLFYPYNDDRAAYLPAYEERLQGHCPISVVYDANNMYVHSMSMYYLSTHQCTPPTSGVLTGSRESYSGTVKSAANWYDVTMSAEKNPFYFEEYQP